MTPVTHLYPPGMAGRPAQRPRTPFGERLAAAREQAGLTQAQLADKLDTTQGAVTHWERMPVSLRPEQLAALADALGVSTDFLLDRPDAKPPAPKTPPGKLRQVFEKAYQLPRHQQNKIVEFVETFIDTYQRVS